MQTFQTPETPYEHEEYIEVECDNWKIVVMYSPLDRDVSALDIYHLIEFRGVTEHHMKDTMRLLAAKIINALNPAWLQVSAVIKEAKYTSRPSLSYRKDRDAKRVV